MREKDIPEQETLLSLGYKDQEVHYFLATYVEAIAFLQYKYQQLLEGTFYKEALRVKIEDEYQFFLTLVSEDCREKIEDLVALRTEQIAYERLQERVKARKQLEILIPSFELCVREVLFQLSHSVRVKDLGRQLYDIIELSTSWIQNLQSFGLEIPTFSPEKRDKPSIEVSFYGVHEVTNHEILKTYGLPKHIRALARIYVTLEDVYKERYKEDPTQAHFEQGLKTLREFLVYLYHLFLQYNQKIAS